MFFRLVASGMWFTGSQMNRKSTIVSEVEILEKSWLFGAVEMEFGWELIWAEILGDLTYSSYGSFKIRDTLVGF